MTSYEVFTRGRAGDDLIHAGSVNAPSDRLARINAHDMYDEEDWHDMFVVPSDAMLRVSPEELTATTGVAP
jgi:1,2-phenylacetyl-CoA epoxidase PaaB subunit